MNAAIPPGDGIAMSQPATPLQREMGLPVDGALDLLAYRRMNTLHGTADEFLYRYANDDVIVLALGDWNCGTVPVRVHSTCFSAHYLASTECDCRDQLDVTLERMAAEGAGIVIFLDQDGRGNGHAGLMRSAEHVRLHGGTVGEAYVALGYQNDARSYHVVPLILRSLGITRVTLFTNNPQKMQTFLHAGIAVQTKAVTAPESERERLGEYYDRKRAEGHTIPMAEP